MLSPLPKCRESTVFTEKCHFQHVIGILFHKIYFKNVFLTKNRTPKYFKHLSLPSIWLILALRDWKLFQINRVKRKALPNQDNSTYGCLYISTFLVWLYDVSRSISFKVKCTCNYIYKNIILIKNTHMLWSILCERILSTSPILLLILSKMIKRFGLKCIKEISFMAS